MSFNKLPKSMLEETEKLEQLRVLEAGYKIRVIETDKETISVDTAEDLEKVKSFLRKLKK
jgi:3-deoxy-manno-octulosonate cytidylyltransferase (CMP-KDO synthetase)